MTLRSKLKWSAIVVALIVVGLQFSTPAHTNPSVDGAQTLAGTTPVPPEVSALFARSCNDCHSNTTNWRWYTYVAPVSWFTVDHVNKGREELNLSEWGRYSKRMKETRLRAICGECRNGEMPLASYALVHRETKLSPDEVKMICEWTENARKQLEATGP
ncbi:MAG TPA: heme-binding domain-containing protein [Pyrinomonadaceae bacterium]